MAIGIAGQRLDPVLGYNFLITLVDSSSMLTTLLTGIQNTILGGFSECSGLQMDIKTEDYNEGGNNGTTLHFPTRVTWTNIRLKRGAALSDDLWRWHYDFVEGKGKRRDGVIILQSDDHTPVRIWFFHRGLPVKWVGPTMNAMQNQVAIEEVEIAHEGLEIHSPGSIIGASVKSLF